MPSCSTTPPRLKRRSAGPSPAICAGARGMSILSRRSSMRRQSYGREKGAQLNGRPRPTQWQGGMMAPRTSPEVGGMGHAVKRKEDPRFIRGQGTYVDDIELPGMLYLDIVRSPYAHATIKHINASKALALSGVLDVITGATLAKYNLHWMPTLMSDMQMVLPVEKV